MAEEKRSTGVVTFFNPTKGFGFIRPHGDSEDLFVHQTEVQVHSDGYRTLYRDQEVEFDIVLDKGRMKASFVTPPGGGAFDSRARRSNGNRNGGGEAVKCHNCGGVGHRMRECPSQPRLVDGGDRACRACGEQGHFAKDCTRGGRVVGGGVGRGCYTCGDPGHFAKDCTRGGDGGRGVGGGGRGCYTCGDPEHFAKDCTRGGGGVVGGGGRGCYTCGQQGHFAKDCTRGSDGRSCYTCGDPGHLAKECGRGGEGKKQESRKCFRCGKTGHFKIDCKEEALVGEA